MSIRWTALVCILFSGLSALVYQIIWTRLLGFTFGTSTEAIGAVLAVFFGGLALGNWIAARHLHRVERPLRVYGLLELAIGVCALASLPLMLQLPAIHGWLGVDHSELATAAIRVLGAALVMLPPTVAMGATLPVVARALVLRNESMGRWSAILYTTNTGGAVLGAYLCGFWLIPGLGLTQAVLGAALVNLAVAAAVLAAAGSYRVDADESAKAAPTTSGPQVAARVLPRAERRWYLAIFGISGFVAIGYEIVWSKVFTIVMEGTLYGFSTVLSAYLFGLALGSLAMAGRVDRIRDLPRAFGLLHVAIGVSVAFGMMVVDDLPYWHLTLSRAQGAGIHSLFLLVAPLVLVPTACFGAAFPVLIRLYSPDARAAGEGIGLATAVNTAGSIFASLTISFWSIDAIGIDATLYLLIVAELFVGVIVLLRFQQNEGARRWAASVPAIAVFGCVAGLFNGVHVEQAATGRWIQASSLEDYRAQLEQRSQHRSVVVEGKTSVVTVHEGPAGWVIRNNGLPESNFRFSPPHRGLEAMLLAGLPYLVADRTERALVIGFGGGSTVDSLLETRVGNIEVIELEQGVIDAIPVLYRGRPNPLEDPRVQVRIADGRNELLMGRYRQSDGYDLISSQPSHPWLLGAANLFTEEFFELVRDNLNEGGAFTAWVNGFHTDDESLLAIIGSFERVFPGSVVVTAGVPNPHNSYLLLGARQPIAPSADRLRARLADPGLASQLKMHGIHRIEDLLARFEGPSSIFAELRPELRNTDDGAFVESRLSRRVDWADLDFTAVEAALAPDAPTLPGIEGSVDLVAVAQAMLPGELRPGIPGYAAKLSRLLRAHGGSLDPVIAEVLRLEARAMQAPTDPDGLDALARLAEAHPDRPEPLRSLARHALARKERGARAAEAFGAAWKRSGDPRDAALAARSWRAHDPARAFEWMERVPAERRGEFPELALLEAERALDDGAPTEKLERLFGQLVALRDTESGRRIPGVNSLLARLATAAGQPDRARAYFDMDLRERDARATPLLARARRALEGGELEAAKALVDAVRRMLPGDPRVSDLGARIAVAAHDKEGLRVAFSEIRHYTPGLSQAVAVENHLRSELGVPLLPQRPPEDLIVPRRGGAPSP